MSDKKRKPKTIFECIELGYLLTIKDVVQILSYQPLHCRKLCRENKLDSVKINGVWYVTESSVKKYTGKKSSSQLREVIRSQKLRIEELEDQLKLK